ncbi:MAG: hypothetical protein ACPL8I_13685, partial [Chloroflexaceae bacterium]
MADYTAHVSGRQRSLMKIKEINRYSPCGPAADEDEELNPCRQVARSLGCGLKPLPGTLKPLWGLHDRSQGFSPQRPGIPDYLLNLHQPRATD